MKKAVLFLLILIFSRIGIAFGADAVPSGIQNFFLGSSATDASNINQVLALLVGPAGPPGPAGVAGRDGFVGMNGVDGMPGAPGPVGETGATGAQGLQGVAGAQGIQGVAGAQGIQGEPGAAGAAGPAGAIGPAGPSGAGGSFGISGGTVGLKGCDSNVDVNVSRSFSGTAFNIDSLDFSAIEEGCLAQNLYVYFSLSAATKTAGTYGDATQIRCTKVVTGASLKIDNSTPCYKNSAASSRTYSTAVANFNQAYILNSDTSIGIEITTLG
jgi:hypothetical protein